MVFGHGATPYFTRAAPDKYGGVDHLPVRRALYADRNLVVRDVSAALSARFDRNHALELHFQIRKNLNPPKKIDN